MENKLIPINEDVIKGISIKLTEYLDLKDSIFENEFVESFGDSFKLVKLFKTGHDLISRRKFNAFLKGICYDDTPTDEQLLKLHKYINNETKAEFIADMFSKILMSNSKLACMIMGIMISDLTTNNKDIVHKLLICANSLTSFFDDDIRNFNAIIQFMQEYMNKRRMTKRKGFYEGHSFNEFCKKRNLDVSSMNMTLYKSISLQLFMTDIEVNVNVDVDEDFYTSTDVDPSTFIYITKAGELLYTYVNKISSYLE